MNTVQVKERQDVMRHRPQVPAEHDWDWEYTGEFFMCLECGHEFREPPYDHDFCPECGAGFWPESE